MPTPEQARRALTLVTTAAVTDSQKLITGSADQARSALLSDLPDVVAYYSDGSAALAADHYDDLREASQARSRYTAEPVVDLRAEKIRRGAVWATEPLYLPEPDTVLALSRLADVVQFETATPFRQTITKNARRDPDAVGWQRITGGGCKFCRMLSGRGAIYKADTAHFAAHPNCGCSAAPVFGGQHGEPASVMQYVASKRHRTPAQQQALRDYLAAMPD